MNSLQQSEKIFHNLAPRLKYFSIHDALYNRFPGTAAISYSKSAKEENIGIYQEIRNPNHSKSSLLQLLKDNDPKIRTLAILALYCQENPSVLPQIAALANDPAPTYPEPQRWAFSMPMAANSQDIPLEKKTVGQIAQAVLSFYMTRAGYHYGLKGSGDHPGFEPYWQKHEKLKYCASWFSVKLARASQGTTPTPESQKQAIRAVRKELDFLPSPEREWILLSLQQEPGFDAFASQKDLVLAMQKLGPQALMLMLQGKINSPDPDLQPRTNDSYPYQIMQLAILKHAKEVLRTKDADTLIKCGQQQKDYRRNGMANPFISSWWAIAASYLQPTKSPRLLHDEFTFFSNTDNDLDGEKRAALAAALWQLEGLREKAFLVDTFYNQNCPQGSCTYRCYWLKNLARNMNSGKIIEAIITDKRFDNLNDSSALVDLALALRTIKGKEVLSDDLWRKAWHPLGLDRACSNLEEARKEFPKETTDLLQVLKEWRTVIKQSLSQR